jgi:hypothetical protein
MVSVQINLESKRGKEEKGRDDKGERNEEKGKIKIIIIMIIIQ